MRWNVSAGPICLVISPRDLRAGSSGNFLPMNFCSEDSEKPDIVLSTVLPNSFSLSGHDGVKEKYQYFLSVADSEQV